MDGLEEYSVTLMWVMYVSGTIRTGKPHVSKIFPWHRVYALCQLSPIL